MNKKLRRRVTIAAGASIAGAAIPIAAAFTAWADTEITYDGMVLYDDFDTTHPFGSSDVGTAALSGTNNDWAIVSGPASDVNDVGLANDSAAGDSGDFAYYQASTVPTNFFGEEGAQIANATNSYAEVFGGGQAVINPALFGGQDAVSGSTAIATNGGTALISNDGNVASLTTMTDDDAFANGTGTGPLAGTSSVGEILDSNSSVSIANDTGFNATSLEGGSAVDVANNSFAYATNAGSAANVEGGVVNGVPLSGGPAITDASNLVGDGNTWDVIASNAFG
ncbi:MAG: hypothetical protein ACRDTV_17575, partial [Mycobacterium sp.]